MLLPCATHQARRGENVDIRIPLFEDKYTPEFIGAKKEDLHFPLGVTRVHGGVLSGRLETVDKREGVDGFPNESAGVSDDRVHGEEEVTVPHVHMDAMAFGMGCCCLQVTFQVMDLIVVVLFFDVASFRGAARLFWAWWRLFLIPCRARSSLGVFSVIVGTTVLHKSGILLDFLMTQNITVYFTI